MEILKRNLVSETRDRNTVLGVIVPKILGILHQRGNKLRGFGGCSVRLTDSIVLSASRIDAHRLMVSVYDGLGFEIVKVLSLHVTDFPTAADPSFYRYCGGQVALMTMRRGNWEGIIGANDAASIPSQNLVRYFSKGAARLPRHDPRRAEDRGVSRTTCASGRRQADPEAVFEEVRQGVPMPEVPTSLLSAVTTDED